MASKHGCMCVCMYSALYVVAVACFCHLSSGNRQNSFACSDVITARFQTMCWCITLRVFLGVIVCRERIFESYLLQQWKFNEKQNPAVGFIESLKTAEIFSLWMIRVLLDYRNKLHLQKNGFLCFSHVATKSKSCCFKEMCPSHTSFRTWKR